MPTKQTNTPIQLISAWTGALIHHTEFVTFLRQSEDDDEKNGEGERDGEGLVYTSEYKKWYPGHVGPFVSYLPPSSRALHDACRRSHSRMRFLRPTGGIERTVELGRNEGFGLHPSSLASWAYLFCPRAENQKRKAQLNERTVADHGIRKKGIMLYQVRPKCYECTYTKVSTTMWWESGFDAGKLVCAVFFSLSLSFYPSFAFAFIIHLRGLLPYLFLPPFLAPPSAQNVK